MEILSNFIEFKSQELLQSVSRILGYENNFFLCSESTSDQVLSNVCHAMVITGSWTTFLHLDKLKPKLMSCLSSVLNQSRTSSDTVLINAEPVPLHKSKNPLMYFATVHPSNKNLSNAHIDSLKITKFFSYLGLVSRDLLESFRVVYFNFSQLRTVINTSLIVNGSTHL